MALSFYRETINSQGEELLEHGTTLLPVGCYDDDMKKYPGPWHWHDEMEALIVLEGKAEVAVGTEKYILGPGEGCFINANILHATRNFEEEPCRSHSVCFHPRLVGGSLDSVFWQNYLRPLLEDKSFAMVCFSPEVSWHAKAMEDLESAWHSCVEEPAGYEFLIRDRLSHLIFLLKENRPAVKSRASEKALRDAERMKRMLQYVQEHYAEELDVAQIAESAMISASECLRCFRSTIGTTPMQYVIEFRIQMAAELLAGTEEKITEVGTRCGFQEMRYFAKTFRKLKGCTPSEYRKKIQRSAGGMTHV